MLSEGLPCDNQCLRIKTVTETIFSHRACLFQAAFIQIACMWQHAWNIFVSLFSHLEWMYLTACKKCACVRLGESSLSTSYCLVGGFLCLSDCPDYACVVLHSWSMEVSGSDCFLIIWRLLIAHDRIFVTDFLHRWCQCLTARVNDVSDCTYWGCLCMTAPLKYVCWKQLAKSKCGRLL